MVDFLNYFLWQVVTLNLPKSFVFSATDETPIKHGLNTLNLMTWTRQSAVRRDMFVQLKPLAMTPMGGANDFPALNQ